MLLYVLIATYCFVIAFTRFTSAVTTVVPDFSNLLSIAMQLFFWFTPVIWNLMMLAEHPIIAKIISLCRTLPYNFSVNLQFIIIVGSDTQRNRLSVFFKAEALPKQKISVLRPSGKSGDSELCAAVKTSNGFKSTAH